MPPKNRMLIALMQEYKRAAADYEKILTALTIDEFQKIRDVNTTDPDCHSIQTVSFHIVQSGHTYANYINQLSTNQWFKYKQPINTPKEAMDGLREMFIYTDKSIEQIIYQKNSELALWTVKTRWNVTYDLEQLLEHAIVHVLRHRRQVEHFLSNSEILS